MPKTQAESPEAKSFSGILSFFEKPFVHLTLILLFAIIVYSNTFNMPFQFDDFPNIVKNEQIRDISNVPSLFTDIEGSFASRPLMHATFALNYHLGGLETWGYHIVNLAIHLINGMLLYFLVLMTGKHLGKEERAVKATAFLASLLFLIHPVQTEAVTYIVSRSMLLATAFYFSGTILFLKAVSSESKKGLWIAGLFVASLLGMASRENFVTFPIMLVLYDLFFVSRFRLRAIAENWKVYVPVFLSLGYLAFLIINNTYPKDVDWVGVSAFDYFLAQFNVHWTYLRLLALPINQTIDYDYPLARTLLEFPTTLSFIGYLCIWAVTIVLARRRPAVSFAAFWFLITFLPISFGVTLISLSLDDVIFEHRLYLPGAGLMMLLAVLLTGLGEKSKALLPVLAVGMLILGGTAYARNAVWSDGTSLWADALRKSPRKARPYLNLGFAYESAGLLDKAEEHYLSALGLNPEYFEAHYNLGHIYSKMGRREKSIEHFRNAIKLNPYYAGAHYRLGTAYLEMRQNETALKHFRKALELDPNYAEAHNNIGIIYSTLPTLHEEAIEHFNRAISFRPTLVEAHFNLGVIYLNEGLLDAAYDKFETVLMLDPNYPGAAMWLKYVREKIRQSSKSGETQ